MEQPHYAVFDIEATGLDLRADRIIDLAVVYLRADGSEIRRSQSLFDPGCPLRPETVELTGIRDEDLAGAPGFRERARSVRLGLTGPVLIAHNLHGYDLPMLGREMVRSGLGFTPAGAVCTLQLFRTLEPDAGEFTLAALCERHGVVLDGAHRALADAVATAALVRGLIERGIRPEEVRVDQEPYYRVKAAGNTEPATEWQWRRLLRMTLSLPAVASGAPARASLEAVLAEVGVDPMPPVRINKEQMQAAYDRLAELGARTTRELAASGAS